MKQPLISICIPAYKRISFLKRLLDSVAEQSFRDFEVIVTDDSPDMEVELFVKNYTERFPFVYFRNQRPLGSPANWNKAIQLASGSWIKIMHDDDWFAYEDSLLKFARAAQNSTSTFIFSGFENHDLEKGSYSRFIISSLEAFLLRRNPLYLFRKNLIGHPSTTLIRNNRAYWFDEKLKWVVDFEFYIRLLKEGNRFVAIKEPLIHIGIGEEQITKLAFRNPEIEIPENFYLFTILGKQSLRNIFVYDYYWRLLRNLRIKNLEQINCYLSEQLIPKSIETMIRLQRIFGQKSMSQMGLYSKSVMLFGYITQYFKTSS
jgi:glycosyltransferase involved in cell wall biosynthesis